MKRKLRTTLSVGCLVLGAAAYNKTSAAGYSSSSVSYEEIQDEFVKTCKSLNWPGGYEVPEEIDYKGDDSSYEKGFGIIGVSLHWKAAWEKEWLNNYRTDSERAERALAGLEKATKMTYVPPTKRDDATRETFAKHLGQARHGDPSGFGESIKLNAPE